MSRWKGTSLWGRTCGNTRNQTRDNSWKLEMEIICSPHLSVTCVSFGVYTREIQTR
jgi:hypothetical protein